MHMKMCLTPTWLFHPHLTKLAWSECWYICQCCYSSPSKKLECDICYLLFKDATVFPTSLPPHKSPIIVPNQVSRRCPHPSHSSLSPPKSPVIFPTQVIPHWGKGLHREFSFNSSSHCSKPLFPNLEQFAKFLPNLKEFAKSSESRRNCKIF